MVDFVEAEADGLLASDPGKCLAATSRDEKSLLMLMLIFFFLSCTTKNMIPMVIRTKREAINQ